MSRTCKNVPSFRHAGPLVLLAVLICLSLAAGLALSVSLAGRWDREAYASAEQVAPAACYVQERSPAVEDIASAGGERLIDRVPTKADREVS